MKKVFGIGLAATALGLVVFAFLQRTRDEAPLPRAPEYNWANKLVVPLPPPQAYRPSVLQDPVERALSRLVWGTPELANWTQSNLPEDRDRLARRLIEELEKLEPANSIASKRLIETLGLLDDERGTRVLLRFAQQEPDYLQLAALRALAECRWNDETLEGVVELTRHANLLVRSGAKRALLQQPGFMDLEAIRAFLIQTEGQEANVVLEEVGVAGMAELADAVARHLDSSSQNSQQIAMRTLMRLDDPRGYDRAEATLDDENERLVELCLTVYRDVGVAPPHEIASRLTDHPTGDVRRTLCQVLAPRADDDEATTASHVRLLQRLAEDPDAVVKAAAIIQLHKHGRHEHVQGWMELVSTAHGDQLKEAVRFLCESLKEQQVAPLLRARLEEGDDTPTDTAHLLFGLRFVGGADDCSVFIQWILRGGSEEDRRREQQTYLSEFASLYLQTLGEVAIPSLLTALEDAANPRAVVLVLDALRGVVSGPHPDVTAALLRWVEDSDRSLDVRLAAADSLVFLRDPGMGESLLQLSSQVDNHHLGQRLRQICASYF